jgi:hypothetical protein
MLELLYSHMFTHKRDVNNQSIKCFHSLSFILSSFQTNYVIGSAKLISKFV